MNAAAFDPCGPIDDGHLMRLATEDDLPEVVRIEELCQPAPWPIGVFRKELDLEFSRTWVVEERDGKGVVGFLTFWLVHDELHVLNICVHPRAQRRGLARALLDELERIGLKEQASLVSLEVRATNTPAKALYESMGFVPIGSRPRYYADNGEDAELLVLLLEG